jgi:hypothetical protein
MTIAFGWWPQNRPARNERRMQGLLEILDGEKALARNDMRMGDRD